MQAEVRLFACVPARWSGAGVMAQEVRRIIWSFLPMLLLVPERCVGSAV